MCDPSCGEGRRGWKAVLLTLRITGVFASTHCIFCHLNKPMRKLKAEMRKKIEKYALLYLTFIKGVCNFFVIWIVRKLFFAIVCKSMHFFVICLFLMIVRKSH